jgi:hypothetical protein
VSEKRTRALLALGLVIVVAVLSVAVLADRNSDDGGRLLGTDDASLRHAERLCHEYAASRGQDPSEVGYGATTVAKLKLMEASFKVSVAPWDKLPDDHFVAQCSGRPTATTATTRCGNGSTTAVLRSNNFLADDQGRVTDNPAEHSALFRDEPERRSWARYPRRASDLWTWLPGWRYTFDPRPAGVPCGDEFGPGEASHWYGNRARYCVHDD